MERNGVKYINPTQEAQAEWKKKINHLSDISLFPTVKSTYVRRLFLLLRFFTHAAAQVHGRQQAGQGL